LLDEVNASGFERFDSQRRVNLIPCLIHVYRDFGAVAKRGFDFRYVRYVITNATPANLQLVLLSVNSASGVYRSC
jgi:hypothetical protein